VLEQYDEVGLRGMNGGGAAIERVIDETPPDRHDTPSPACMTTHQSLLVQRRNAPPESISKHPGVTGGAHFLAKEFRDFGFQ
jgi:hypothetical protein